MISTYNNFLLYKIKLVVAPACSISSEVTCVEHSQHVISTLISNSDFGASTTTQVFKLQFSNSLLNHHNGGHSKSNIPHKHASTTSSLHTISLERAKHQLTRTLHSFQRSAALKLDWAHISSSLGLRGQTAASLQAFKKRNEDARRRLQVLSSAAQTVDFAQYRAQLKNQSVVDEMERQLQNFKPKTYDVERQVRAIEKFEAQAVRNAQDTKGKVDEELGALDRTLANIEGARSVEELTVVCCSLSFWSPWRRFWGCVC